MYCPLKAQVFFQETNAFECWRSKNLWSSMHPWFCLSCLFHLSACPGLSCLPHYLHDVPTSKVLFTWARQPSFQWKVHFKLCVSKTFTVTQHSILVYKYFTNLHKGLRSFFTVLTGSKCFFSLIKIELFGTMYTLLNSCAL